MPADDKSDPMTKPDAEPSAGGGLGPEAAYDGICQRCQESVGEGEIYRTVKLEGKLTRICESCYSELLDSGELTEADPAAISTYLGE
jgi:hypothetical protein